MEDLPQNGFGSNAAQEVAPTKPSAAGFCEEQREAVEGPSVINFVSPLPLAPIAAAVEVQAESSCQVELDLFGTRVLFPYEPYAVQREYMSAVLSVLQEPQGNAILESPTGTGKTLCLLCASLAWAEAIKAKARGPLLRRLNKIILYASRTHAQLAQVVREFKKTTYARTMRMCVLGSREHLCVNREVLNLPSTAAQNAACTRLRAAKQCRYAHRTRQFACDEEDRRSAGCGSVYDIEDLVAIGKKECFCPYFFEKEAAETADIIFLPYTYVMDPSLQKQISVDLKNCVLLVDEAHNIPSVVTSSSSVTLTPTLLAHAIAEASRAANAAQKDAEDRDSGADIDRKLAVAEDFAALKLLLVTLEKAVDNESWTTTPQDSSGAVELVRPGDQIFDFLAQINVTTATAPAVGEKLAAAVTLLSQANASCKGLMAVQQFLTATFAILNFLERDTIAESFRFVLQRTSNAHESVAESRVVGAGEAARTVGLWCVDTSTALRGVLQDFSCIVFTSGTLSPIDHLAAELGLPFRVIFTGDHVIQPSQLRALVCSKGPSGVALNGSFTFRNSVEYRASLGMAIVNLVRNVPDGVLVFFPSYVAMCGALESWKTAIQGNALTVYAMLSAIKPVFEEPRDTSESSKVTQLFQRSVDEGRGGVLLAVCRGKVSEGIDFADKHGRCVIVAGVPYANSGDLLVRLKREHLTRIAPTRPKVHGKLFTGDDWYRNEAMRAVNQCIGRVIRHKDDYGAIVLADERFSRQLDAVSPWVVRSLEVCDQFGDAYKAVTQFFFCEEA